MARVIYRLEYVSGSFPYIDENVEVMVTNCTTINQFVKVQVVDSFNQLVFDADREVEPGFTWTQGASVIRGAPPLRIVIRTTDQMVPSAVIFKRDDLDVNATTRMWPDNFVVFPLYAPPVVPPISPVPPAQE